MSLWSSVRSSRLEAEKTTYIPQGIIINETKVCAQYIWFTGAVASRMSPTAKAVKAIIIMILPGTRCKI